MRDVFRPLLADIKPQELTADGVYVHVARKELTLHSSCTSWCLKHCYVPTFFLNFFRTNKELKVLKHIQLKYNKWKLYF